LSDLNSRTKLKYNLTLDDLRNESTSHSLLNINTLNDTHSDCNDRCDSEVNNSRIITTITPTAANTKEMEFKDLRDNGDRGMGRDRMYKSMYGGGKKCNESECSIHVSMDSMSEIRSCIENVHFDHENMLKFKEDVFNKLNKAKNQSFKTNTLKLDMIDLRSC